MTSGATRVIQDANGTSIAVAKTAQEIFDPQNTDGTPATGNTFAAINSLLTALQNNDTAGVAAAVTSLQSAGTYLNNQLAFYGEAENQVSTATPRSRSNFNCRKNQTWASFRMPTCPLPRWNSLRHRPSSRPNYR